MKSLLQGARPRWLDQCVLQGDVGVGCPRRLVAIPKKEWGFQVVYVICICIHDAHIYIYICICFYRYICVNTCIYIYIYMSSCLVYRSIHLFFSTFGCAAVYSARKESIAYILQQFSLAIPGPNSRWNGPFLKGWAIVLHTSCVQAIDRLIDTWLALGVAFS